MFTQKMKEDFHVLISFNDSQVIKSTQKYVGIILNASLTFKELRKMTSIKVNLTIGLIKNLHTLLRYDLLTVRLSSRLDLDYGGIIFGESHNSSSHRKLKNVQCALKVKNVTGIKIAILRFLTKIAKFSTHKIFRNH